MASILFVHYVSDNGFKVKFAKWIIKLIYQQAEKGAKLYNSCAIVKKVIVSSFMFVV